MVHSSPVLLILGHSFVRRLCHDLKTGFDQRADLNLNLQGTAVVFMHSVGGRTVPKLRIFDLHVVKQLSPDIIILEIGTNDLTRVGPEVVGSEIDDFVRFLVDNLAVRVVGVCHVIPRVFSCAASQTSFLTSATALNHLLCYDSSAHTNPSVDQTSERCT